MTLPDPPARRVRWTAAWRIIASRYPPIQLFERLTDDPSDWEVLADIESLTNPRVRDAIGQIRLVPPEDRVAGPGASWVMASFTHVNPRGSRFSDGSYGVYYAADRLATSIAETTHHMANFYALTDDPPHDEEMRVLCGKVDAGFHDLCREPAFGPCLQPDDYGPSRALGAMLRAKGSNGVVYPSVRHAPGRCLGAFRPKAVGIPRQERHLRYHWDGVRIARYFDYALDLWLDAPGPPQAPSGQS